MSKSAACSKGRHFHVVGKDAFESDDFTHVIEAIDPNSALASVITTVADDWEGAIEVNDHSTMTPNSMPLIDFWRTPLQPAQKIK
jgi:hypothetical protein